MINSFLSNIADIDYPSLGKTLVIEAFIGFVVWQIILTGYNLWRSNPNNFQDYFPRLMKEVK